jgi:hypothetical protein
MESVQAKVAVPQQEIVVSDEFVADDGLQRCFSALYPKEKVGTPMKSQSGAPEAAAAAAPPKARKVKVTSRQVGTYNYFNNRLQSFDPDTFDKSIFPSKCDKPRQPVALTPSRIRLVWGLSYDFSHGVPELERSGPHTTQTVLSSVLPTGACAMRHLCAKISLS